MSIHLPSEWHRQAFTQMTWPHKDTDWAPVLSKATDCFCNIAKAIAEHEKLLIIAQYPDEAKKSLHEHGVGTDNIVFFKCATNDTWARDHAFITCLDDESHAATLMDFQFNGWGMKFAANHDNMINSHVKPAFEKLYANVPCIYDNHLNFVLEGGSIESDGEGTLMVTSSCLLSENRNNTMNQTDIESELKKLFNADRIFWINHSWLAGDDTDGHIDTVARFCSPNSITYVKCYDENDEHFAELNAMEKELEQLRTKDDKPYKLYPLPLPDACYDDEGNRLPATHANFLIINEAVLVPTYQQPEKDKAALEQLALAFPDRKVIGIDCSILIVQHGSLHCSTMQYPAFD